MSTIFLTNAGADAAIDDNAKTSEPAKPIGPFKKATQHAIGGDVTGGDEVLQTATSTNDAGVGTNLSKLRVGLFTIFGIAKFWSEEARDIQIAEGVFDPVLIFGDHVGGANPTYVIPH